MSIEVAPETAEALRARQVAEVEAMLVQSGVEVHALVMEQLRWQLGQGTVTPALVALLGQARASMLRGLRQQEKVTRQEVPATAGSNGLPATKEGRSFDFAAFAKLFLSLAGYAAASTGPAGADDPELALGTARADDETGSLPGGAGS
ncbi:MAG TPA: hypothetical protein VIU62_20615 [Chloroflexota bacterium]